MTDARESAAKYTESQLTEQFATTGPKAITTARRLGPVVVDYFGLGLLPFDEAISIGILEGTVHHLRRALDLPAEIPGEALTHTAAVLAAMASPIDFIEAATGRTTGLVPVLS